MMQGTNAIAQVQDMVGRGALGGNRVWWVVGCDNGIESKAPTTGYLYANDGTQLCRVFGMGGFGQEWNYDAPASFLQADIIRAAD